MEYEPQVPDAIFPSDNDLEIPSLRADMQCTQCEIPFLQPLIQDESVGSKLSTLDTIYKS